MYRINLYPQGMTRRAERSRAVGKAALVMLLAGAHVVFLGLFFVTAMNVGAKAEGTKRLVAQQKGRLQDAMKGNRLIPNEIRLVVERRNERLAWAPILSEVSTLLPDNLILDEIAGTTGGGESARTGMTLQGHLRAGHNMDQVIEFTRRLSESSVYRSKFGEASLGSMESNQEVARFRISCPLIVKAAPDSASEDVAG